MTVDELERAGAAAYIAGACLLDCPHVDERDVRAWRIGYFLARRADGNLDSRITDELADLDPASRRRDVPRRIRRMMRARALDPCPRCGRARHGASPQG